MPDDIRHRPRSVGILILFPAIRGAVVLSGRPVAGLSILAAGIRFMRLVDLLGVQVRMVHLGLLGGLLGGVFLVLGLGVEFL